MIKKTLGKKSLILYAVLAFIVVVLNIIAWKSTAFCDAYIRWVFPIWVNTYGRFMNLFAFSVGEIMLFSAVGLTLLFLCFGLAAVFFKMMKRETHRKIRRVCKKYIAFYTWLVLIVCFIMTLNCTILYHASTFSEKYVGEDQREYTAEDMVRVRNFVVEQCSSLSAQMERNEKGEIIYRGDIRKDAVEAMKDLGKTYDQLDGYYPYPKPLATSDFFSQQYMCGYYFPFSMEANYNDVMYVMNMHATLCHELAHLRGYIFEDEANFISYLACIESDNPVVRYSGYLSVLYYLENDFNKAAAVTEWLRDSIHPAIPDQVHADNIFLTEAEWERIEKKALLDTETVDEVSDAFTDTVLKANGVRDGKISYSRVVRLLLQYYDGMEFCE